MYRTNQELHRRNEAAVRASESMFESMKRDESCVAKQRARQVYQEEALADAIESRKREAEARQREVQRICEADPGLRELQEKLKMAYVSRERAEQKKERFEMTAAERAEQARIDAALEADRVRHLEEEAHREAARREEYRKSKIHIQRQIEEKERRRFIEGEEAARKEREMVDNLVRKVMEDDESEARERARKAEETKRFIKEFQETQDRYRQAQREAELEEERRIQAYNASRAGRAERVAAAKAEEDAAKEAIYRDIVRQQEEKRAREREEERLRWLLVEEEAEQARLKAEHDRVERQERMKREMMEANEEQKRIRARLDREAAEREAQLVDDFMRSCADADSKERAAAEAREQAKREHIAAVAEQARLREEMYRRQLEQHARAEAEARAKEEFQQRVVEEARRRLLEEHASMLQGYLPKGVIRSKEDLDLINRAAGAGAGRGY